MFVLQGNGHLARVAEQSKRSYNMLFQQWEIAVDLSKSPKNTPQFYTIVDNFGWLASLVEPVPVEHGQAVGPDAAWLKLSESFAFWNPVFGGGFMLYATYMCCIGAGSATVDSLGQLRFILHLYNWLMLREPTLNIPFLASMDTVFKGTRAVWFGAKPEKGSCAKAFWVSWGMNARRAEKLASEHAANKNASSFGSLSGKYDMRSTMDRIWPDEFSASYRRLIQHDYRSYTPQSTANKELSEAGKHQDFMVDLLARFKMIRDAMEEDGNNVLPVNFAVVGSILLDFMDALSDHMGWADMMEEVAKNYRGARLGESSMSELNVKDMALSSMWGRLLSCIDRDCTDQLIPEFDLDKVSVFTKSFFDKVDKTRYIIWVQPLEATSV
ncbi:hypothetical protein FisN_24Lu228 [Fistulifera solaris]|uniref:Uncharacterized protein n=1 Tax=Fistulifera solaris TaxID=1519565 RepID=A0A1Z5KAC3_FISSO|nr:hypothetical protein FisN_24Lu228 [Fistulifera solaris]|eukprot:GAX22888.1 hypothetical protein FisN_24Lu228 [Fistulifera solaris]